MAKILVEGIKLYSYHGCTKEEAMVGGNYVVDVCIEANLDKPSHSDNLNETIDYVMVYEVVKKEMSVRSNLIEHVAKRIFDKLKKNFSEGSASIPKPISIEVKVAKLNPPVNGVVEKVCTVISE